MLSINAGIPGVREHSCFLKEVGDAQKIRRRIMDCIETSIFKDQPAEEVKRLLHMVVVGGGPTGIEFAGEMQDFFSNDLKKWIPDIKEDFKITLVEALPKVCYFLPCRLGLNDGSSNASIGPSNVFAAVD